MALKATELQMLMRERREAIMKETDLAFRGISQRGLACGVFVNQNRLLLAGEGY